MEFGPVELGQEIRRRREELGLTQAQLSEKSGLSPNAVGQVERAEVDTGLTTIVSIAGGLGIPPAYLLPGLANLPAIATEAAHAFAGIAPEEQPAVLVVLRSMSRRK